ncbi:MAG: hypothetical protein SH850_06765 [Planctomycetaceae bacterium]|nr:hypothetical protein [Planctomycetaceae bacterium]
MTHLEKTSPMRWGVWCDDVAAGPWLKALARETPAPTFVAVRATPADDAVWHAIAGVEFIADWPTLLIDRTLDAVFMTGTSNDRLAAMRQLAEQDRPLWIWPDAQHGLPFAYELALIANDRTTPLHGVWRHRCDPVLQAVVARHRQGDFAGIEHIEFARTIRGDGIADGDASIAMQQRLLSDLDLVRWLGGHATRVTALRTTGPNGRLWKQSALLAAESGPGVSWTGEIVAGAASGARVHLHNRDGGLVLVENAAGQWSAEGVSATTIETREAASVPWTEVVRVFEWFDACEHSLERRRTIELHSEPASERTVFKTQMTAIGCGVLMATLLFALLYLAVGATIGDPQEAPSWVLIAFNVLRLLVFAPLAIFLIAQLLLPLTRTPPQRD